MGSKGLKKRRTSEAVRSRTIDLSSITGHSLEPSSPCKITHVSLALTFKGLDHLTRILRKVS